MNEFKKLLEDAFLNPPKNKSNSFIEMVRGICNRTPPPKDRKEVSSLLIQLLRSEPKVLKALKDENIFRVAGGNDFEAQILNDIDKMGTENNHIYINLIKLVPKLKMFK